MAKKIVIACFDVPGMGGASTASYKLFARMQADGLDASFVNIVSEEDADYFHFIFGEHWGNPQRLANVYSAVLTRPPFSPSPRHNEIVGLLDSIGPDAVIGLGPGETLLLKAAAPHLPLILIMTGCQQVKHLLSRKKTRDFVSLSARLQTTDEFQMIIHRGEYEAVSCADLVATNSEMLHQIYSHFFPMHAGKLLSDVIWFAEQIYREALEYACLKKPFANREIDVLFIANDWNRVEKNFALVERLVAKTRGLQFDVVGEVERKSAGVNYHGLVPERARLFALMGNARTVASPSAFDTAPGILFEASAMGCNVVASRNCGNWQLCHPLLLVDPFELATFRDKLALSVTRKFDDNIDFFLQQHSYQKFLNTLDVF